MLLVTIAFCETGFVPKGRLIAHGDEICHRCDLARYLCRAPPYEKLHPRLEHTYTLDPWKFQFHGIHVWCIYLHFPCFTIKNQPWMLWNGWSRWSDDLFKEWFLFWGDELCRGKTGVTKGSEASLDQKHGWTGTWGPFTGYVWLSSRG